MPPKTTKASQSAAVLDVPPAEPLHDKAFKPSGPKKGVHPTLGGFPKYLPNPPRELKRKVIVEGEEDEGVAAEALAESLDGAGGGVVDAGELAEGDGVGDAVEDGSQELGPLEPVGGGEGL